MKYLLGMFFCCLVAGLSAAEQYRFRVYLKDKGKSGYTVEQPEAFLSRQAIERRERQQIAVTPVDLPISQEYIRRLTATGAHPVVQSKWMDTVVVESADSTVAERLSRLPMVDSVKWVWKGRLVPPAEDTEGEERLVPVDKPLREPYGHAHNQIRMLNGIKLHKSGFRGAGMRVAVIDAGFKHVDRMAVFDSLRLLGTHNVLSPGKSVFAGDDHGTKVLSCLAANLPGVMIGTAPEASYLLLKSEDSDSEYPVEEDYWIAAVEYADSVGVDIISSSLGYFEFDAKELSYKLSDLDGQTALISRAATLAAERGILLFCSAGNEGNHWSGWGKITFPADAKGICTVGAVDEKKRISDFSSVGYAADGRVKPDVVALGTGSCVTGSDGNIHYLNGTSFATPILAGLGVCLWQALPTLDNRSLIRLLQCYASQYKRPDKAFGYGIPDVYKAYRKGKKDARRRTSKP